VARQPLVGHVEAKALHVMSLNIRRPVPTRRRADRWQRRAPLLQELLRSEQPALLGVQEVVPEQMAVLQEALGGRYRSAGTGRGRTGDGEACPIWWDEDRVEVLGWHQRALSDRPTVPGSISWGNLTPRIAVTATVRDRATSARALVVNTHLDHLSGRSRVRAAVAIRQLIARQSLPAIVTGDLNAGARSASVKAFLAGGTLVDAWEAASARLTPAYGTFASYRPPRPGGRRIDWILVSPDVEVLAAGIDGRQVSGGWASDHLPVHVVVRLPEGVAA
jgi:endonuclease/exonuclease/phosphatase family metal-dependent hydrolase